MCLTGTTETVHQHQVHDHPAINRRSLLRSGAALAAGAAFGLGPALPAAAARRRRLVDLTHWLRRDFPTFVIGDEPVDTVIADFDTAGFYNKRWEISEHTGTHIDTPGHFTEGLRLVDEMVPEELVVPIVVVDIRRKAMDDPNAMVEPDDLLRFERRHGRIPTNALVCMNSGWDAKVFDTQAFRGGAGYPDLNFPGFGIEAALWLAERRDVAGIGVDTLSLDPGNSADFAVHFGFLATDRYGVENVANLSGIPPIGATAFVGPVPWEDGSGSPCRVIATW
jgi:kynurenine formamidase